MHNKVIRADTIDAAVERILDELKEDTSTVIYFDGWEGLGASAVLRAIAQRLNVASEAPVGLQFGQILLIDCSKWENLRMLQRAIAKQLVLPDEVMEMFDRQDDEDDFNGVSHGARGMMEQALKMMHLRIQQLNRRFLVIFLNGGNEEIDLATLGFPLSMYLGNKVLWTFQGRFRVYPRTKVNDALYKKSPSESTHVFLSASPLERQPQELIWSYLVEQEAAEVAARGLDLPSSQIAKCFLDWWKLCCMSQYLRMDYDLETHGSNYWICDGIIGPSPQQQERDGNDDDRSWRLADALKHEMRLDTDCYSVMKSFPSNLVESVESMATMPYWTSPAFGVLLLPASVDMPLHYSHQNNLVVLKLAHCTFSLSSPPLHRCHNLRFLWLNHCHYHHEEGIIRVKDDDEASAAAGSTLKECFQRLWVLDVRYTCCDGILSAEMMQSMTELRELNVMGAQDWDMVQMQGCLPNIRKLRITKSTILYRRGESSENLFSGMDKMELLDFSGNRNMGGMESLSTSNKSSLESIIIDEGCVGLTHSSFRGCAKLKNVLLRGPFEKLKSIDISGTAVKTLDLSAVKPAQKLIDEVVALGCDKLRAVLWSPEAKWIGEPEDVMGKLWIDTTVEGASSGSSSSAGDYCGNISVGDARLLRSLVMPFESYLDRTALVLLEISSPGIGRHLADAGGSKEEIMTTKSGSEQPMLVAQEQLPASSVLYEGIAVALKEQTRRKGNDIAQIWPCPPAPELESSSHWYLYIQDRDTMPMSSTGGSSSSTRPTNSITVPDMICRNTRLLHVHDSKSVTCVSPVEGSTWKYLKWCRVERCPSMDCVFICPGGDNVQEVFRDLQTLWLSQLLRVRCIWNLSRPSWIDSVSSFRDLEFVHMDLCPRLTHVLPLWWGGRLWNLEILEIVWCGELRVVFPTTHMDNNDDDQHQQQKTIRTVQFPELKHIHLHELPMLHSICGRGSIRMSAPKLETIKIRGCWNLSSLPQVDKNRKAKCDCEKEWWDSLKWDSKHLYYEPTHPRHYKKMPMIKGSVLR